VVTAAELLSVAAFLEGKHAQAFPSFGSERTGSPVVSFCRIDDKEIRLREPSPFPNAALLGAFAALTGIVHLHSVATAIRQTFSGKLGEANIAAASAAYDSIAAAAVAA
jgi:Pyruvate/2-oxoacid:ferredoxin oxidoreductase gamma subunit